MRSIGKMLAAATVVALGTLAALPADADDLVVYAAASLREALTEVTDLWAYQGKAKVVLSFAASSTLAKQIENGAPAGLFVSADEQWMDYLADRSLVVAGTRTDFLGNDLVLIASKSRPFLLDIKPGFDLAGVLGNEKLAMADVDSVPAGRYGKAALAHLGVWSSVEGKVVRQTDVRAALALVERDEARAGVVYRTDALTSEKVMMAGVFPFASHEPILYSVAILQGHDTAESRELREFLLSPSARAVFTKHGFSSR